MRNAFRRRFEEFRAQVARRDREDLEAPAIVAMMRRWREFPEAVAAEWITPSVAQGLSDAARSELAGTFSPSSAVTSNAERIGRFAIEVARRLSRDESYPRVVRMLTGARVWIGMATVLRLCGQHHEALRAVEAAAEVFARYEHRGPNEHLQLGSHDAGFMHVERAEILFAMGRGGEALRCVDAAASAFADHADAHRVAECKRLRERILGRSNHTP